MTDAKDVVTYHMSPGLNERLTVTPLRDGPVCNNYLIKDSLEQEGKTPFEQTIKFQDGPVPEVGVTGVSIESVIAVLIHRLEDFQAGPFSCVENHSAIFHLELAMKSLQHRTADRVARGVEGTMAK